MKCLICGEPTKNKILCPEHSNPSIPTVGLTCDCQSFSQDQNEIEGSCEFFLLCQPLKKALKGETVFVPDMGHIRCPYLQANIQKLINSEFTAEELKQNYKECLD